ncbi:MAG: hypothetical protein KDI19_13950 [Pseudomonadales bacterium]|nr:hypothetical protein [Pseudomonadales bacterium]
MKNGLRGWFGIHTAEDDLVDLIQVASTDETIRTQLIAILSQDDFTRQSMINTWLAELRLESAPAALIRALADLIDNDKARTALALLTRQKG